MSDTSSKSINLGFPLVSILTTIFTVAKLTGHFAYSWWVVFLPVIVSAGVGLTIIAVALIVAVIAAFVSSKS